MDKGRPVYEELGMSKEEYIKIQRELMGRIFRNTSTKVGLTRELIKDIQSGKYTMEDVIIAFLNCLETTGRLMQVISDASQNSLRITKSILTMLDGSFEKLVADAATIAFQIESIKTDNYDAIGGALEIRDRLDPVHDDMRKLIDNLTRTGSIIAKAVKTVENEADKIIQSIEQEIEKFGGE